MSIINSFRKNGKPKITVEDVYKKNSATLKVFIVTFSEKIIDALINDGLIELLSEDAIKSISCSYPVYRFVNSDIGIVKTTVGAPITSALIEEVAYVFSCKKVVFFGSCGGLDKNISPSKIIIPTDAYRDEGTSYHYLEPSDYIKIKNADKIAELFSSMNVDFAKGKTWTTDAFYRETEEEVEERKSEGCICVEMEVSACQAVCDYAGLEFYPFLYRADNLDASSWDKGVVDKSLPKDERLKILSLAYFVAKKII